jgi:hypothetical protein
MNRAKAEAIGQVCALALGDFLIARSCRRLSEEDGDERYVEWTAELPAILSDPDLESACRRGIRMLLFAVDQQRAARRLAKGSRSTWHNVGDDISDAFGVAIIILRGLFYGAVFSGLGVGMLGSLVGLLAIVIGAGTAQTADTVFAAAYVSAGIGGIIGVLFGVAAGFIGLFDEFSQRSAARRNRHSKILERH